MLALLFRREMTSLMRREPEDEYRDLVASQRGMRRCSSVVRVPRAPGLVTICLLVSFMRQVTFFSLAALTADASDPPEKDPAPARTCAMVSLAWASTGGGEGLGMTGGEGEVGRGAGCGGAGEEGLCAPEERLLLFLWASSGGGPALETVVMAEEIALDSGIWGMAETVAATMAAMWSEYAFQ